MNRPIEMLLEIAKTEFDGRSLMGTALMPYLRSLPLETVKSTGTCEGYSVWAIALHVLFHKHVTIKLLGGTTGLEPFPYQEADWPQVPARQDDAAWRRLLQELEIVHGQFLKAMEDHGAAKWNQELPQWKCTMGQVLECMACHDLYHVAQIRNMGLKDLPK
jgi:uncharacterized damage-inducible protein DinB